MLRKITSLFYLLMLCSITHAQDFSSFKCWIDSNYAGQVPVSGSDQHVSMSVPLDGLKEGVHFFNFLAANNDGTQGNIYRSLFYIPTAEEVTVTGGECWIDDDYANRKVQLGNEDKQNVCIDISQLSAGVHFFNFRTINSDGGFGNIVRTLFYLPEEVMNTIEVVEYEYWLDEDVDNKVTGSDAKSEYAFTLDVSTLKDGEHTFNFRVKNSAGLWSEVYAETFTIDTATGIDTLVQEGELVDVFNLAGFLVKHRASLREIKQLPSGIFLIKGKKVLVQ